MKIIKILLVEDDQLDVIDFNRSLSKLNILSDLAVVKNGEEAITWLEEECKTGTDNLPDFVLIDINMPKMNGIELLGVIRTRDEWKHLKCFIITTSEEDVDKRAAEKLGISGYIVKPFKLNNMGAIDSFNLMMDLKNS